MTHHTVEHATFTIELVYTAGPESVFAAWADPEARTQWGPPSPETALTFEEADFCVGGRDISWCGLKGAPEDCVETRYVDLVSPHRLVFTETISHDGKRLSNSLITVELTPEAQTTRLALMAQVAALDRADMVDGNKAGWAAALENLDHYLDNGTDTVGARSL